MSSVSSTRSRAWSILSGLSLTQILIIAVLKLPLYDTELDRFYRLASASFTTLVGFEIDADNLPPTGDSQPAKLVQKRYLSTFLNRIQRGLYGLERNPLPGIAAGPVGYDPV